MAGQKESNRGKRPKMYYSDNVNTVHVYDVVRITRGYFKDKLAICSYVNFKDKRLSLTVIDTGTQLILNKSSVEYCYHNTKTAARQWFDIIDKNIEKQRELWSNIKYIKDHWNDPFSHNDIVAKTIADAIGYPIHDENHALEWLEYWSDALNLIFAYPDADFCAKLIDINTKGAKYSKYVIKMIHNFVWK
jgi:hypothetical protein